MERVGSGRARAQQGVLQALLHRAFFWRSSFREKSLLIRTSVAVDFTQFIMHLPIIIIYCKTSHFRHHKKRSRSNTAFIQKSIALFAFQYDSLLVCRASLSLSLS